MSEFLNPRFATLAPYTPGEQPKNASSVVKLNTNENPYPPAPGVLQAVSGAAERLHLYCDPACKQVAQPLSRQFGLREEQVMLGNGSDELLAFAFLGLCPNGAAFADLTYGFYPVYARLYDVDAQVIPLQEDFTLNPKEYYGLGRTIFIANPNAPTGLALSLEQVESILQNNANSLVVLDEAYVDFGAQTALPLLSKYNNLLIIGTFSKSRSLAGARLGYAASSAEIIADLNRIKFSFNPYNVNGMTLAAGAASLADTQYFETCRNQVIATRQTTIAQLTQLGFSCTDSKTNFVFCSHSKISGEQLYHTLHKNGILVRWFNIPRIQNHLRITIGTPAQMQRLFATLQEIIQ